MARADPHTSRICQFLPLSHVTQIHEPYAITVVTSMRCDHRTIYYRIFCASASQSFLLYGPSTRKVEALWSRYSASCYAITGRSLHTVDGKPPEGRRLPCEASQRFRV